MSEDYVPHGYPMPPYMPTVGYWMPRSALALQFRERVEGHGSGMNVRCDYWPRGDAGPQFAAGAHVLDPKGRLLSPDELRRYRTELRFETAFQVALLIDQHNACVEPYPT